ncbi:MAG: phospho-sugar mutase [Pirellulaceae bacterium]
MKRDEALAALDAAARDHKLTAGAVSNIHKWLTEPPYARYAAALTELIADQRWQQLDDLFWTTIPFGTGGRRGRMNALGTNAINDRTIGESAAGLAQYVRTVFPPGTPLACAVAYDTRHRSRHFAELCASIMVAAGFRVYLLDGFRSTPELSFLVRWKQCHCGIMVTASHNPPSDNAVKVYWSTGGQVLPPHDKAIMRCVEQVDEIVQADFPAAVAQGQIILCTTEIDDAFCATLASYSSDGPRDVHILYSPLHGVGTSAVCGVLARARFRHVSVYPPHATPDGDFPNVPGHVSNPENPRVFDALIEYARGVGANLVLATDPDCDRMGCAAPVTLKPGAAWATLNGNQLGALLADYVLQRRQAAGTLSPRHYLLKTLVTTELIRRIGDAYGVRTCGDLPVGFKWIGGMIDAQGPDHFLLGCEESHGYLIGQHARDKDGAVACLLMSELAARLLAVGKSLHEKLDDLFWQHGVHTERLLTCQMEGSEGMAQMQRLMAHFRERPPAELGGLTVLAVRDYLNQTTRCRGSVGPLAGPHTDMVILDFTAHGNSIAVRPSGTEPKVKFYLFAYTPAEQLSNLAETKAEQSARLDRMEHEVRALAQSR